MRMDIDFPLLKTFKIDSKTLDFLNRKSRQYFKECSTIPAENEIFMSDTGQFTSNLLDWSDKEYQQFLREELVNIISDLINIPRQKIDLHYQHIFDYKKGGYVKPHNHVQKEDFVVIIYLNTCNKGKTSFYLNHRNECRKRTKVEISPIKGNGVCFSSVLFHEAERTYESKKIFVVGVKIDLLYGEPNKKGFLDKVKSAIL
tara:strand:- start:196 stop:798 length:603 start_codon:yes stop_codon:yes gene_type:complete